MKKLNIKSFVLGMLVMAIVMSTAAPAVASTMKAAQLYYKLLKNIHAPERPMTA